MARASGCAVFNVFILEAPETSQTGAANLRHSGLKVRWLPSIRGLGEPAEAAFSGSPPSVLGTGPSLHTVRI